MSTKDDTPLDKAVAAAIKAHDKFVEQDEKIRGGLSAESFVKAAELQAGIERKTGGKDRLEELAKALEKPGYDALNMALSKMQGAISGEGYFKFSQPTKRLGHLLDNDSRLQLASIGATEPELFALASRLAAVARPSAFGSVHNMSEAESELKAAEANLAAALKAIETSWGAADVEVLSDGRVRITRYGILVGPDMARHILDAAVAEARAKKAA